MGALIWLAIAIGLAIAEFAIMDFSLLMLALAALITAGVAVADIPLWAEVAVFAVSSMLSLALLRPILRKTLAKSISDSDFSAKELEGRSATVIDPVSNGSTDGGMVKIDGELWSARAAYPGEKFIPGDAVQVLKIEGATAVVWKGI